MPEQIIRDLVIRMLQDIDYDPLRLSRRASPKYLFKAFITTLDEDINIVDQNSFEVFIKLDEYNQIIFNETKYGLIRISRQRDAIHALSANKESPKAWLIVTAYYHSFFSAILISRLLGRFSCYFSQTEISNIRCSASNSARIDLCPGNYVGYYVSCKDNSVRIRFKYEGDKPHFTAWKNLCDKVQADAHTSISDTGRRNRIQLFRSILNDSVRSWPLPSDIRNKWNYSDISLYSKKGDDIASEFAVFLGNNKDLEWASRRRLEHNEKNVATSIAFISSTLRRTLDICEKKILR
ncbi:MAG: hypothetical protein ACYDH8_02825 [Syntrophales bacterium]